MSAENDIESVFRGLTDPHASVRSSQRVSPKHLLSRSSENIYDPHAGVVSQLGEDLTKPRVDGSRFWAVVIGVNTYPYDTYLQPLSGAVSDALSMHEYLTNELKVPSSNIRLLTEGTNPLSWAPPTRENILNALYDHLRDNESVFMDDNMLIYFAGHGSSYSASGVPGSPGAAGSVEAICPMDRGRKLDEDVVPDISDREINIFLSELCQEKGANITVIHDCCYSGGMARGLDAEELPTRFGEPLLDTSMHTQLEILLTAADNDPRRMPRSQKAFSDTYIPDISSSIHLAACMDFEKAHEFRHRKSGAIHGLFTHRLLTELRNSNSWTKYSDIEKKLKSLSLQHPEFVGSRVDCRLWYTDNLRSVRQVRPLDPEPPKLTNGAAPEKKALTLAEQGDQAGTSAPFRNTSSHARTSGSSLGRRDTSKLSIHLKETGALEANTISPVQNVYNAPSTLNDMQPPPTFAHPNSTGPEGPVHAPSGRMRTSSHPSTLDSRPQSIGSDTSAAHDVAIVPDNLHLPEQKSDPQLDPAEKSYNAGHGAASMGDDKSERASTNSSVAAKTITTTGSPTEHQPTVPLDAGSHRETHQNQNELPSVNSAGSGQNTGEHGFPGGGPGRSSLRTRNNIPEILDLETSTAKKTRWCCCCTIM